MRKEAKPMAVGRAIGSGGPASERGPAGTCRRSAPRADEGPRARLYQPARSVVQSAPALRPRWVLEFEPVHPPEIDWLMGWTGSRDPLRQVRLVFPTKEAGLAFARRQGLWCEPVEPNRRAVRPKRYADQFRRSEGQRGADGATARGQAAARADRGARRAAVSATGRRLFSYFRGRYLGRQKIFARDLEKQETPAYIDAR